MYVCMYEYHGAGEIRAEVAFMVTADFSLLPFHEMSGPSNPGD